MEGSDSHKIYEMGLQYDPETRVALPVIRRSNKSTSRISRIDDTSSPDDSRGDGAFFKYEPLLEPQRTGREMRDHRRYDYSYPGMFGFPTTISSNESASRNPAKCERFLEWRWTQKQLFDHFRHIWKCLIALMYGHEVSLPDHSDWWYDMELVAGLRTYAEALDMPDEIMRQIGRMLMSMPKLCRNVYDDPCDFMYLADAVKHSLGQGFYINCSDKGLIGDSEEMHALILAGAYDYEQQLADLRHSVCRSELLSTPSYRACRRCGPWCNAQEYRDLKNDCFGKYLYPILAKLTSSSARREVTAFGRHWKSAFQLLRWLIDLAPENCEDCGDDLFRQFGTSAQAMKALVEEKGLDIAALAYEVGRSLQQFRRDIGKMSKTSCVRSTENGGGDCDCYSKCPPRSWFPYKFCSQPRYQPDDYWVFVDFNRVYATREVKPSPLNGELKAESSFPVQVELVPASYTYLESIGLGTQFKHVSSRSIVGLGVVDEDVWSRKGFSLLRRLF